jgi:ADP-glucose pyrophosphorylase
MTRCCLFSRGLIFPPGNTWHNQRGGNNLLTLLILKVVQSQKRIGLDWYRGTADSVRQNLYLLERYRPRHILVLSGDHIYRMDYSLFLQYHIEKDADLTVSLLEVSKDFSQ